MSGAISVVNSIRSRLARSICSSFGSWIVVSPRASAATFSATMSRAKTRWPSSAKQAAVTSPTQPTPITPIGSRSATRGRLPLAWGYLRHQHLGRGGDPDHLVVAERLQEVVGDPVDVLTSAPGDQL